MKANLHFQGQSTIDMFGIQGASDFISQPRLQGKRQYNQGELTMFSLIACSRTFVDDSPMRSSRNTFPSTEVSNKLSKISSVFIFASGTRGSPESHPNSEFSYLNQEKTVLA